MKVFERYGADWNAIDQTGLNSFLTSIKYKQYEIESWLLSRKHGINAVDSRGFSPLMFSIELQDKESFDILIQAVDVEYRNPNDGSTALHIAASVGNKYFVEALLDHGLWDSYNKNNESAVSIAKKLGFSEIADVVEESGMEATESPMNEDIFIKSQISNNLQTLPPIDNNINIEISNQNELNDSQNLPKIENNSLNEINLPQIDGMQLAPLEPLPPMENENDVDNKENMAIPPLADLPPLTGGNEIFQLPPLDAPLIPLDMPPPLDNLMPATNLAENEIKNDQINERKDDEAKIINNPDIPDLKMPPFDNMMQPLDAMNLSKLNPIDLNVSGKDNNELELQPLPMINNSDISSMEMLPIDNMMPSMPEIAPLDPINLPNQDIQPVDLPPIPETTSLNLTPLDAMNVQNSENQLNVSESNKNEVDIMQSPMMNISDISNLEMPPIGEMAPIEGALVAKESKIDITSPTHEENLDAPSLAENSSVHMPNDIPTLDMPHLDDIITSTTEMQPLENAVMSETITVNELDLEMPPSLDESSTNMTELNPIDSKIESVSIPNIEKPHFDATPQLDNLKDESKNDTKTFTSEMKLEIPPLDATPSIDLQDNEIKLDVDTLEHVNNDTMTKIEPNSNIEIPPPLENSLQPLSIKLDPIEGNISDKVDSTEIKFVDDSNSNLKIPPPLDTSQQLLTDVILNEILDKSDSQPINNTNLEISPVNLDESKENENDNHNDESNKLGNKIVLTSFLDKSTNLEENAADTESKMEENQTETEEKPVLPPIQTGTKENENDSEIASIPDKSSTLTSEIDAENKENNESSTISDSIPQIKPEQNNDDLINNLEFDSKSSLEVKPDAIINETIMEEEENTVDNDQHEIDVETEHENNEIINQTEAKCEETADKQEGVETNNANSHDTLIIELQNKIEESQQDITKVNDLNNEITDNKPNEEVTHIEVEQIIDSNKENEDEIVIERSIDNISEVIEINSNNNNTEDKDSKEVIAKENVETIETPEKIQGDEIDIITNVINETPKENPINQEDSKSNNDNINSSDSVETKKEEINAVDINNEVQSQSNIEEKPNEENDINVSLPINHEKIDESIENKENTSISHKDDPEENETNYNSETKSFDEPQNNQNDEIHSDLDSVKKALNQKEEETISTLEETIKSKLDQKEEEEDNNEENSVGENDNNKLSQMEERNIDESEHFEVSPLEIKSRSSSLVSNKDDHEEMKLTIPKYSYQPKDLSITNVIAIQLETSDDEQEFNDEIREQIIETIMNFPVIEYKDFIIYYITEFVHIAIELGNFSAVKLLAKFGYKINALNHNGENYLHSCVKFNQYNLAASFINLGIDIDQRSKDNKTPLFFAIQNSNPRMVKLLLDSCAQITNIEYVLAQQMKDNGKNELEIFCLLRKSFSVPQVNSSEEIMILMKNQSEDNIIEMLNRGNLSIDIKDEDDNTLLHWAIAANMPKLVKYLIDDQVNINAQNSVKRTPLHFAAAKNSVKIANIILEKYPQILQDDNGDTPLELPKRSEMKRILLNYGKNLCFSMLNDHKNLTHLFKISTTLKNELQDFILCEVIKSQYEKSIAALFKNKANVNYKDSESNTILHLAAKTNNPKIVKTVLQYKPLILKNKQDLLPQKLSNNEEIIRMIHHAEKRQATELDSIIKSDNSDGLKGFIDAGLDPNYVINGFHLVHICSSLGAANCVKTLILSGANINAKTKKGETAATIAVKYNYPIIFDLFVASFAKIEKAEKLKALTLSEDQQIITLFNSFGSSWQKIASYFQGRTANSVRNRFLFLNRRNQNTNISQFQSTDSEVDVKIEADHLTELFVVPDFQIPVDSIFFDCQ